MRRVIPSALFFVVWLGALGAPRAQVAVLDDFTGEYRFAGTDAPLASAVGDLSARFGAFTRLLVMPVVQARAHRYERVRLELGADRATFTFDDWGPITTSLDGTEHVLRDPNGDSVTVTQRVVGERLHQTLETPRYRRVHVLHTAPDGVTLYLDTRIELPQAGAPLEFTLRYRRVG